MKVEIFDYGMNGEGVARVDGKIFLVDKALIDEIVDIEIEKDFPNYAQASVKNVEKPSSQRVIPPCPYYTLCGGCDLQHMNYSEQLRFKTDLVKKTIKKISGLDCQVEKCVACLEQFGYRNKCSFAYEKNQIGFFRQNSKQVINIEKCLLAQPNLNKILQIFKTEKLESVKFLVVREINSQILVGVVASEKIDLAKVLDKLKTEFENIGLYLIVNTRKDAVVLSGKTIHVGGIKEISVNNFGIDYSVDLLGFHQTNIAIQNKIYDFVLSQIKQNEVVVNGFSGQGLLSAILATKSKKVYGIEINSSSHSSAEKLKERNHITNLTNIKGDFNQEINKIKKVDCLILDPSKKGVGKQTLLQIKDVEKIIYISCNPIALAKDLSVLKDDYDIVMVVPFDMFPNTKSVETVLILKKK